MKRSGPIERRTRLKPKRDTPRRTDGRVTHERTKPAAGSPPDRQEAAHLALVAAMPCLVCGKPATVHHVTGFADRPGRIPRSHRRVVPLCPPHHQKVFDPVAADPISVEGLSHQGFFTKYGIDLMAVGNRLWTENVICGRI